MPHEAPPLTPDRALQELLIGNRRYASDAGHHPRQSAYRRAEVASGQHPFAVVIGCSDSRVPPEVIFDCGLGDLFVIRAAGHVLGDTDYASAQYAAEHLGVNLIVVLGHSSCGAVKAALDGMQAPGHLGVLLARLQPALAAASGQPGDPLANAVLENVRMAVARLKAEGPILPAMIAAGKLAVVGAHYDLSSGLVTLVE
jgi:carbonic anhydrase